MDTDSFIPKHYTPIYKSKRYTIRELGSDRGTNDDKIRVELHKEGIDWIKNQAAASNFGGVYDGNGGQIYDLFVTL